MTLFKSPRLRHASIKQATHRDHQRVEHQSGLTSLPRDSQLAQNIIDLQLSSGASVAISRREQKQAFQRSHRRVLSSISFSIEVTRFAQLLWASAHSFLFFRSVLKAFSHHAYVGGFLYAIGTGGPNGFQILNAVLRFDKTGHNWTPTFEWNTPSLSTWGSHYASEDD